MKISELVEWLEDYKSQQGDIEVVVWNKATDFDEDIGDVKYSTDLREGSKGDAGVVRLVGGGDRLGRRKAMNEMVKTITDQAQARPTRSRRKTK